MFNMMHFAVLYENTRGAVRVTRLLCTTAAFKGGWLRIKAIGIDRYPWVRAVYFFLSWLTTAVTIATTSDRSAIISAPKPIMIVNAPCFEKMMRNRIRQFTQAPKMC